MVTAALEDDLITGEELEFAEAAMPPAACAAVVALLVHESCPLTSEALSCSGSRLYRWVLAETEGLGRGVKKPHRFGSLDEWFEYSQAKMRA